MNDLAHQLLPSLAWATLALTAAAIAVGFLLRRSRAVSPRLHQAAWCAVLVVGCSLAHWPIAIPWYEPSVEVAEVAAATELQQDAPTLLEAAGTAPYEHFDLGSFDDGGVDENLDEHIIELSTESPTHFADVLPAEEPVTYEAALPHVELSPAESPPVEASPPLEAVAEAAAAPPATTLLEEPAAIESAPTVAADDQTVASALLPWKIDPLAALLAIWIAGMAGIAIASLASYLWFIARLPAGLPVDEVWETEWRELLAVQRVRRAIPLRVTNRLGPLLCRLPRGYCLVVPRGLWSELDAAGRQSILRHELAHWQRGDVWRSLAVRLLALPQWFNPASWYAVRKFDEAAEWACDRIVAHEQPVAEYAKALLSLATDPQGSAAFRPAAAGKPLASRIRRLLRLNNQQDSTMKTTFLLTTIAAMLALAMVRVELVAREAPADEPAAAEATDNAIVELAGPGAAEPGDEPVILPPSESTTLVQHVKHSNEAAAAAEKAAALAYAAHLKSYESGQSTLDPVYTWSLRWLTAAERVPPAIEEGKPAKPLHEVRLARSKEHLERMRALQQRVQRLHDNGAQGGEATAKAAVDFYVAEAERRVADAETQHTASVPSETYETRPAYAPPERTRGGFYPLETMSATISGPAIKQLGEVAEFTITVINKDRAYRELTITSQWNPTSALEPIQATEGCDFEADKIRWRVAGMAPGEQKQFAVQFRCTSAIESARLYVQVLGDGVGVTTADRTIKIRPAARAGAAEAPATTLLPTQPRAAARPAPAGASPQVAKSPRWPRLAVELSGSGPLQVGDSGELKIVVHNTADREARNITVTCYLDPALATTNIDPSSGKNEPIIWKLSKLAAGERKELAVAFGAVAPAEKAIQRVIVRDDEEGTESAVERVIRVYAHTIVVPGIVAPAAAAPAAAKADQPAPPSTRIEERPARPRLTVDLQGPGPLQVGEAGWLKILVRNAGGAAARGVTVTCNLASSLQLNTATANSELVDKNTIRWRLDQLPSGETKEFQLAYDVQASTDNARMRIIVRDESEATEIVAEQPLQVLAERAAAPSPAAAPGGGRRLGGGAQPLGAPKPATSESPIGLKVTLSGPDSLQVGDSGELKILVQNVGSQAAKNVEVVSQCDPAMKVSQEWNLGLASQTPPAARNEDQAANSWKLAELKPGERKELAVVVQGVAPADQALHRATVRYENGPTVLSERAIRIASRPAEELREAAPAAQPGGNAKAAPAATPLPAGRALGGRGGRPLGSVGGGGQPRQAGLVSPAPPPRENLRFEGKSFREWSDFLENELSPDGQAKAIDALTTLGAHGWGAETARLFLRMAPRLPNYQLALQVGMGQLPRQDVVPVLTEALKSDDARARLMAVETLGMHVSQPAEFEALFAQATRDASPSVRTAALLALAHGSPDSQEARDAIARALADDDAKVTEAALKLLAGSAGPYGPKAKALQPIAITELAEAVTARLSTEQWADATWALIPMGAAAKVALPQVLPWLEIGPEEFSSKTDAAGQDRIYWALQLVAAIGPDAVDAVPALVKLLETAIATNKAALDGSHPVLGGHVVAPSPIRQRTTAVLEALAAIGPEAKAAIPLLGEFHGNSYTHSYLVPWIRAVGAMGPAAEEFVPLLESIANEKPLFGSGYLPEVVEAANEAIKNIRGE